jgi:hypothetical protein
MFSPCDSPCISLCIGCRLGFTWAAGLVLEPLPVSAWSLVCVTVLLLTKACTFEAVMGGLKNEAIWLSEWGGTSHPGGSGSTAMTKAVQTPGSSCKQCQQHRCQQQQHTRLQQRQRLARCWSTLARQGCDNVMLHATA